jgi:hypothetical protein
VGAWAGEVRRRDWGGNGWWGCAVRGCEALVLDLARIHSWCRSIP